jgi:uncharacterized damage-inducible protein DinB
MQEKWPWIDGTQKARNQMIAALSDADLAFTPGGLAMTLGALCREMGDVEYSYIQSLKTFTQDWSYHNAEADLESSVSKLIAWYETLDGEMEAAIAALPDEDAEKIVNRGPGFEVPVAMQLDIYLQALLIFFGKATIYLRAMGKPLSEDILGFIG